MLTKRTQLCLLDAQRELGLPIADIVYHAGDVAGERIGFSVQVCVGAALRPIAGLVDKPCPKRVEFRATRDRGAGEKVRLWAKAEG